MAFPAFSADNLISQTPCPRTPGSSVPWGETTDPQNVTAVFAIFPSSPLAVRRGRIWTQRGFGGEIARERPKRSHLCACRAQAGKSKNPLEMSPRPKCHLCGWNKDATTSATPTLHLLGINGFFVSSEGWNLHLQHGALGQTRSATNGPRGADRGGGGSRHRYKATSLRRQFQSCRVQAG